jgi:hypothetical protein
MSQIYGFFIHPYLSKGLAGSVWLYGVAGIGATINEAQRNFWRDHPEKLRNHRTSLKDNTFRLH